MKKFGLWMVVCICILGAMVGCTKKEESTAEVTESVEEVSAKKEEVSMEIQFSNETGENIGILKIRPTEEYDWSENLVTDEAWKDRYEVPVFVNGILPDIETGWEVKTTNLQGEETIWKDVVLADDTTVIFAVEDGVSFVSIQETETNEQTEVTE
ncbi:hypothetical protein [Chakrabartyella piscis]|uniref:hypothetical protein n=1 Tax=Chakrabartyella piscis TaxID=2918914 RepID=UPI002958BCED|nr:hypothetical protein [Chakrabartyella piscis]